MRAKARHFRLLVSPSKEELCASRRHLAVIHFNMFSVTHFHPLHILFLTLPLSYTAMAATFYTNVTAPKGLAIACTNALLADLDCSPVVPSLYHGGYYPNTTLERACTSECATALASYHSGIASSCNGEVWNGYGNETMPVLMIPEMVRYHYNLTCMTDNGRFCNNVAASYAAI